MDNYFRWILLGEKLCVHDEKHEYIFHQSPHFFSNITECFVDFLDYTQSEAGCEYMAQRQEAPMSLRYIVYTQCISPLYPEVDLSAFQAIQEDQPFPDDVFTPGDDDLTFEVQELQRLERENTRYMWRICVAAGCSVSYPAHMIDIGESDKTFESVHDCLANFNAHASSVCTNVAGDEFNDGDFCLYVEAMDEYTC